MRNKDSGGTEAPSSYSGPCVYLLLSAATYMSPSLADVDVVLRVISLFKWNSIAWSHLPRRRNMRQLESSRNVLSSPSWGRHLADLLITDDKMAYFISS